MYSITFSTITWNLMLKLSKLCNWKYICISRNTVKYMLKYNGFHVCFGTIFRDSVSIIVNYFRSTYSKFDCL